MSSAAAIADVVNATLRVKSARPVLVAHAGFNSRTRPAELRFGRPKPRWVVDLDHLGADDANDAVPESAGAVVIVARTGTDLRRVTSLHSLLPRARRVVIAVAQCPPGTPLPAPVPRLAWPRQESSQVQRCVPDGWALEARFESPLCAGEVLAAAAHTLGGQRLEAVPWPAAGLAGQGSAHWRPGDPAVVPVGAAGPAPNYATMPAADLVLRSVSNTDAPAWSDVRDRTTDPEVPAVDRPPAASLEWEWLASHGLDGVRSALPQMSDPRSVPPVDVRSVNPTGFVTGPERGTAELAQLGGGWGVCLGRTVVVRFHPSGTVTDADVARLRQLRAVSIDWRRGHTGPLAAVRVVAGLAAAGVPLFTSHIPAWAGALGTELSRLLCGVEESTLADDLFREEHSIRLRRCALRTHGTHARWCGLAATVGLPLPAPSRVSVLLSTRRPDKVEFALGQVARQRRVDVELVLVLHGFSGDAPGVAGPIRAFERPLTVVEAPAGMPLGAVLDWAARHASGAYLAKWDDDDWYGPEHLADLLLAQSYSGADMVGCGQEFVYLETIGLTIRRRVASELPHTHVSGPTMTLTRSAFEEVGGFRPLVRAVDTQMLRAVAAAGGRIYRTHNLGHVLRRSAPDSHTWTPAFGYFLRRARQQWRGFRPPSLMELEGETPVSAEAMRASRRIADVVPSYGGGVR